MRSPRSLTPALALLAACSSSGVPKLELTPDRLSLIDVEINTTLKRFVKLTNQGTAPLIISKIEFEQTTGELTLMPPAELELAPKDEATIAVSYTPIDEGSDSTNLIIETNALPAERRVPVDAYGVTVGFNVVKDAGPECANSLGSMSFGEAIVGQPVRRTIRFEATSSGAVFVRAGIDPLFSAWRYEPNPFAMSVPGRSMAELELIYDPRDGTEDEATLQITTSAASTPLLEIPLCGRPRLAALCANPPGITFRNVAAATSTSTVLTLESCGNQPLSISSIAMSAGSSPAMEVRDLPALPVTLDPRQTIDVTVAFSAADTQPHMGYVQIGSNANLHEQTSISVGANVPPPCNLAIGPSAINFYGANHDERRVLAGNDGPADCVIDGAAITAGNNEFRLVISPSLPMTLTAGDVAVFVVDYTPGSPASWPHEGRLELQVSDAQRTELVHLPITGNRRLDESCHLEAIPGGLFFGTIRASATAEEAIALRNVGTASCELISAGLGMGSNAALVYLGPTRRTMIAPGDELALPVVYHPLFVGKTRGTLEVQATDGLRALPLFGIAEEARVPPCFDEGCACSPTQTQVFHRYDTPGAGSAVRDGDEDTPFHLSCGPMICDVDEVSVEIEPSVFVCTGTPPMCEADEGLELDSFHRFRCVDCEVIVQYGALFDGLRACAPKPDVTCGPGTVPTFGAETRHWDCVTTCSNGLYDQHTYDGALVCVPC